MRSKVYTAFNLGWSSLKRTFVRPEQQRLDHYTSAYRDAKCPCDSGLGRRGTASPKSYPGNTLSSKFETERKGSIVFFQSFLNPTALSSTLGKTFASVMDDEKAFMVDYARLGTSKCKKCKQGIEKKSPRIAKLSTNPFSDDGGMMKNYFHINCVFETFIRARATTKKIEDPSDLDGFEKMEEEEKKLIRKNIEGKKM